MFEIKFISLQCMTIRIFMEGYHNQIKAHQENMKNKAESKHHRHEKMFEANAETQKENCVPKSCVDEQEPFSNIEFSVCHLHLK